MCLTSLARMLLRKVIGSSSAIVQERETLDVVDFVCRIKPIFQRISQSALLRSLPQGLRLYCSATP